MFASNWQADTATTILAKQYADSNLARFTATEPIIVKFILVTKMRAGLKDQDSGLIDLNCLSFRDTA